MEILFDSGWLTHTYKTTLAFFFFCNCITSSEVRFKGTWSDHFMRAVFLLDSSLSLGAGKIIMIPDEITFFSIGNSERISTISYNKRR